MSPNEVDRLRYRARILMMRAKKAGRSSSYWKEAEKAQHEYHRAKETLREEYKSRTLGDK